ncbi:hypothetical protein [Thermospira aquatica]|uniref:DUF2490 domain-containing protein n=1 Tax=Thermospira aquatica TaxID=2828656 RepID=A0AAX3BG57_9SPIR|nr:hypothetical protein [Thermospira aquatica]URA11300.1 hypothetical protein KDW03_05760 [Thermospira aquatica]
MAFGQIGFLGGILSGIWSGGEAKTTLGKNTVAFWTLYRDDSVSLWLKTGYQWIEGFVKTEALDYGYQDKRDTGPVKYDFESEIALKFWSSTGAVWYRFSQIHYDEVTLPQNEWNVSFVLPLWLWKTRLRWGSDGAMMGFGYNFWWERCFIDIALLGYLNDGQEVSFDIQIWNRTRDLGFFWKALLYRSFQDQELGRIGFFKQLGTKFVSFEAGYSEWDAGMVCIRGGWKW